MKIIIHAKDFSVTQSLEKYIHRKIHFTLSRISSRIQTIIIRLNDVNGPKGGIDKHCRVVISLNAVDDMIVINDTEVDLYHAIDNSLQRASRAVIRKVRKTQGRQRINRKAATSKIIHISSEQYDDDNEYEFDNYYLN